MPIRYYVLWNRKTLLFSCFHMLLILTRLGFARLRLQILSSQWEGNETTSLYPFQTTSLLFFWAWDWGFRPLCFSLVQKQQPEQDLGNAGAGRKCCRVSSPDKRLEIDCFRRCRHLLRLHRRPPTGPVHHLRLRLQTQPFKLLSLLLRLRGVHVRRVDWRRRHWLRWLLELWSVDCLCWLVWEFW